MNHNLYSIPLNFKDIIFILYFLTNNRGLLYGLSMINGRYQLLFYDIKQVGNVGIYGRLKFTLINEPFIFYFP